jgi:hypothetical protein
MIVIVSVEPTRILKTRFLSRVRAGYRQLDSEPDKRKQSAQYLNVEIITYLTLKGLSNIVF